MGIYFCHPGRSSAILSHGGFTCLFKTFFVVKNSGGIPESTTATPVSECWLFFLPLCLVRVTYTVWGPLPSGSVGTGSDGLGVAEDARAPVHWALRWQRGWVGEGGGPQAGGGPLCSDLAQTGTRAGRCHRGPGHRASRLQGRRHQAWEGVGTCGVGRKTQPGVCGEVHAGPWGRPQPTTRSSVSTRPPERVACVGPGEQ